MQEHPECVDSERRPEWEDKQVQRTQPQHGQTATRMRAPQFTAGPEIRSSPEQQRRAKNRECHGGDTSGNPIRSGTSPDRDGAHGQDQHRKPEQKPDGSPYELEDTEQVQMRAHEYQKLSRQSPPTIRAKSRNVGWSRLKLGHFLTIEIAEEAEKNKNSVSFAASVVRLSVISYTSANSRGDVFSPKREGGISEL